MSQCTSSSASNMRVLTAVLVLVATAAATVIVRDDAEVVIGREPLVTVDVKTKEILILKLLNHMLQPTLYEDIREVAREYVIEDNIDKYLKTDVVRDFVDVYKVGLLPVSEVFVHNNEVQMAQAIKVFRVLYFAKDFDIFFRTACWLRDRINRGMFVYALTAAIFHREDCRGVTVPAPYEIYPYYFVDSRVMNKAIVMKMMKGNTDPAVMEYNGIKKVTEKNMVVIDSRKGVRHVITEDDRLFYFTEDIDLNTYMYYLHMNYPFWMTDDVYSVQKERRGEIMMYANHQLLARYRLERLSHNMCDIKMLIWDRPLHSGYVPKIRLHNGEEMPARSNDKILVTEENIKDKRLLDDIEKIVRVGILTGRIVLRDGTTVNLQKPEDIEVLSRVILGGVNMVQDDAKVSHLVQLFKRILSYSPYNQNKYTYVPTALDTYATCLRDPLFWKVMKRIQSNAVLFKSLLPKYTSEELEFPGVKVESVNVDKLVTFMDEYDMDITNALYLDETEAKKKRSDTIFVVRQRRINHQPFKVTIDVASDKAVDSVVRVFIGPKYDCLGRLLDVNDKRLDMVEIDSFLHKLETGKNTIVRQSDEMNGVLPDRPWTRRIFDRSVETTVSVGNVASDYWYKTRVGFPKRLLLPMGTVGGLPLQIYVIVSPVRTGRLLPNIDVSVMKDRHDCRWSVCIDTMPLGFPFDRDIDQTRFFTSNMKFSDVLVYRKDMDQANAVKGVDTSDMVMKRDDLTYLDNDLLVKRTHRDTVSDVTREL